MATLEQKLEDLRRYYTTPADKRILSDVEKNWRRAAENKDYARMDITKEIVQRAYQKINEINLLLAYDKELIKEENREMRVGLFKERDTHRWWIKMLSGANADVVQKEIARFVDEKLDPFAG